MNIFFLLNFSPPKAEIYDFSGIVSFFPRDLALHQEEYLYLSLCHSQAEQKNGLVTLPVSAESYLTAVSSMCALTTQYD